MNPLTPEQVARLRLPEQYSLRESSCPAPNGPWWALPKHPGAFEAARIERHIASTAELCANGHLPPEALDDVWRRVEGKPSREAELLRAVTETHTAAIKTSAAARAARCDDMEWAQRDADEQEAADAFRAAMSVARKWIEEQKP